MDWFRAYHGTCTDPKLHKASRMARVRRSVVLAAWFAVLETASKNSERGALGKFDAHDLAFMIDESAAVAGRCIEAFSALEMITDGRVAAWSKRQKISDDVAIRVKKHRDQTDKPLENQETEPPRNVTETHYRTEQNRVEKEKGDSPLKPPRSPPRTGSLLPADWQPDPEDIQFALNEGLTHDDVRRETGKFRDYWASATGPRARKSDWSACWRNWVRKAAEDRARLAGRGAGGNGSGGGDRRAGDRQAGRLADTLAVLHRRGSLAGSHFDEQRVGRFSH